MEIKASPNRMQLLMLKRRLTMARRGHKLLKDKRDELMRRFMELIDRNRELRDQVFSQLNQVYQGFLVARGVMSPQMLEEAIMFPKERLALSARAENIMSVRVPRFEWQKEEVGDIYPYGYAHTRGAGHSHRSLVGGPPQDDRACRPRKIGGADGRRDEEPAAGQRPRTRPHPQAGGNHQVHYHEAR